MIQPSANGSAKSLSQMADFRYFCERITGLSLPDAEFHDFSVRHFRSFWALFLEWSGIKHEGSADPVCTDDRCEFALFFPNLRLSYAETVLRITSQQDGERTAIPPCEASGVVERLTRRTLRQQVIRLAQELERLGVKPGDRIVSVA